MRVTTRYFVQVVNWSARLDFKLLSKEFLVKHRTIESVKVALCDLVRQYVEEEEAAGMERE